MAEIEVLESRTNNLVFKCRLCNNFYNIAKTRPYLISELKKVAPQANGQLNLIAESVVICSSCWLLNQEKEGLQFKEPSGLIMPSTKVQQTKINR